MRIAVLASVLTAALAIPASGAPESRAPVVATARAWLATLNPGQRGKANLPWASANRRHWGYRPFARRGLSLRTMNATQRRAAEALWRAALTPRGFADVQAVIARERILRNQLSPMQRQTDWRHPGLYYLAIFGTPRADARWSWRLGGHHLSLNLTYQGERLVSATPWFVGGSPARTAGGDHVMPAGEDLGRQLFSSFSAEQAKAARWPRVPGDIAMQRGRPVLTAAGTWGVSGSTLTAPQKSILQKLVAAFGVGVESRLRPGTATDTMRFAWGGQGRAQYYRIVGADFAIEYLNRGNHVHAVWRHPTLDFGGKD